MARSLVNGLRSTPGNRDHSNPLRRAVAHPRRLRLHTLAGAARDPGHRSAFVRSVKGECLSKLIPIGAPMLRRALHEYVVHYHRERNHQGLGNQLIVPLRNPPSKSERIDRRTRLGGMLSFYERAAA